MLRSLQASETGPLEPRTQSPCQREAGTFVADGFITQKALQIHQGVLGFWGWGSAAVKAPVVNGTTSVFLQLGVLVLLWEGRVRSAPDKTPPTQFPVSGRLISDEFPSQHSCPQASEGGGHRARSQVGTKQRGHTVSISHSPLSHLGRWQGQLSSLSGGRAAGRHRKRWQGHLLG